VVATGPRPVSVRTADDGTADDGPIADGPVTTDEPSAEVLAAAEEAGLRYVTDAAPGIRRIRRGRGVSYVSATGEPVGPRVRERIESLAIPPAWTDVWICPSPSGHVQATGRDARGRKQYRYHQRWREVRDAAKFTGLLEFAGALPALRTRVVEDLARPGLPPEKVVAVVIALLDQTLIRVGNDEYRRENGTFGLTTLESDHVEVEGSRIHFCFVGKGGREHEVSVADRRLARAVRSCHELGGRELFTYRGDDGEPVRIDSADCNEYLAGVAGDGVTVKYFRTWGATVAVVEALVAAPSPLSEPVVLAAIDDAAERLGNTRAVCRRSYVHPLVLDPATEAALRDAWASARSTPTMTRAERATLRLLVAAAEGDAAAAGAVVAATPAPAGTAA
jgi:DNA topoisomerase I